MLVGPQTAFGRFHRRVYDWQLVFQASQSHSQAKFYTLDMKYLVAAKNTNMTFKGKWILTIYQKDVQPRSGSAWFSPEVELG